MPTRAQYSLADFHQIGFLTEKASFDNVNPQYYNLITGIRPEGLFLKLLSYSTKHDKLHESALIQRSPFVLSCYGAKALYRRNIV